MKYFVFFNNLPYLCIVFRKVSETTAKRRRVATCSNFHKSNGKGNDSPPIFQIIFNRKTSTLEKL